MRYVITCLVTRNTLLPLVVLACLLVVLSYPPVVIVYPFVVIVCPFVCPLRSTRLSTRSFSLSTLSTRSTICPSFYNWSKRNSEAAIGMCSSKSCNIHRKTPVLESIKYQVFSCEYYEIFKNSFFKKNNSGGCFWEFQTSL